MDDSEMNKYTTNFQIAVNIFKMCEVLIITRCVDVKDRRNVVNKRYINNVSTTMGNSFDNLTTGN